MKLTPPLTLSTIVLAVTLLSACSAGHRRPEPQLKESFIANITDQGLKQFTYSLQMQPGAGNRGGGPALMGGRPPGGGMQRPQGQPNPGGVRRNRTAQLENQLLAGLEARLEETGFCHNGYFVLEKNIEPGNAQIRGECKSAEVNSP